MSLRSCGTDCAHNHTVEPDIRAESFLSGSWVNVALHTGNLHPGAGMKLHSPAHNMGKGVHDTVVIHYDLQFGKILTAWSEGFVLSCLESLKQLQKLVVVVTGLEGLID